MLVGVVMLGIVAGMHWYVWRRLVRDSTATGSLGRRLGTGVIVFGGLSLGAMLATRIGDVPFALVRVVSTVGFLWAAVLIYLLLGVLVGEVVRPLLARLPFRSKDGRATSTARDLAAVGDSAESKGAARAPSDRETPALTTGSASSATDTPERAHAGTATTERTSSESRTAGTAPASNETVAVTPASPATEQAETTTQPTPLARRVFVSRALAGVTAVAAVATVGGGTYGVLKGPAVNYVTVPLRRLPADATGFRITLVSDLHLGPVLGRDFTRTVVDAVNGTRPDLIAIAGDLVDASVADLRDATAPLADLRAPHGVFFGMGNHEYYSGPDEWIEYLPSLGMRVLLNSRVSLASFDIAGVDDVEGEAYGRGPDMAATLRGRDTTRPCVLLAHQPVLVHDAVDHGVDLQLSGHTHGGQLFPGNLLAGLANPTVAGLERYGDTQLYVTRGAGAWGPPTRVAAPSDITVLELVPDTSV